MGPEVVAVINGRLDDFALLALVFCTWVRTFSGQAGWLIAWSSQLRETKNENQEV
jgi:hypothetical protein